MKQEEISAADEIQKIRHNVIIGSDIVKDLFPSGVDPLGKEITVAGMKLTVTGVLKTKGSGFGNPDRVCFMPITTARQYFSRPNMTFNITIMPINAVNLDVMTGEAEAVFRIVRNLNPKDESDFNISKSDNIVNMLLKNIRYVTLAATIIGIVTLFGAAVGLMNIMLVSVTERTREIGVRKAIGAKTQTIKYQFLFESIMIGQLGGIFGIILGNTYRKWCIINVEVKFYYSMDLGIYRNSCLFYCRCCFRICSGSKSS